MASALKLHPEDNVLIALRDLRKGERVEAASHCILLASDVGAKHKFATNDLHPGDAVLMYGVLVGRATQPIQQGSVLTTLNIRHEARPFQEKVREYRWTPPSVERWADRSFSGYQRSDGQVGTRNYWLVVPLVFCENRNVEVLKEAFEEELGFARPRVYRQQVAKLVRLFREGRLGDAAMDLADKVATPRTPAVFKNVDGVKFLLHQGGCGGTREDAQTLCGLIAGYLHHPNVAGATILSLGCQNSQVKILRDEVERRDQNFAKPLLVFEQQKSGTEFDMLSEAVRSTFLAVVDADQCKRSPAPLSHLCVGLKCGGSDGFSGISANPAVGQVSDLVVALGGRTSFSEFPG